MASVPTTRGSVLGASILPATTAAGIVFTKFSNILVIAAFVVLNILILVWQVGGIFRFAINRKRVKN